MAEENVYLNALPAGSMLLEYRLESVLGAGGFGITYLGWDTHLEKHVAIKEYLPGELAIRALDGSVVPVNTESEFNYKWGLERFIQEARTLAKFSHPNIVRVNRYFEAHGTSYMVMDYEAGESLYQSLKRAPTPDEARLKSILLPILDGLEAVHRTGFLHRDIKPSNVFIRESGSPVLLDFGSARHATSGVSKNLTAIVSPGYAPLEQYAGDGNQGPWSDIYALSGVMFRAVTSENPPDAVRRMKSDEVPAKLTAARARYGDNFLKAIEWGLALDEKMRPQSVATWRELFSGRVPMTAMNRGATAAPTQPVSAAAGAGSAPSMAATRVLTVRRWRILRRVMLLAMLAIAISLFFKQRQMEREFREQAAAQVQSAVDLERKVTQRFDSADRDRSGDLSRAEFTARFPNYADRFDEVDADHNGVVSLEELAHFMRKVGMADEQKEAQTVPPPVQPPEVAADKSPEPVPPPAPPAAGAADAPVPPHIRQEFDTADRNGDGYLTPQEVRGRFPFIERNFSLVDADHDGRISPLEYWQLRQKRETLKPRR